MKKNIPKSPNNNLKKKRKRNSLNESDSESGDLTENKNKKIKKEKTNEYLTITKKDDTNFMNNPKLPFIKSTKKEYNIKCEEFYDNLNKTFYQVRNSKILKYQNKNILFIHIYNKLMLYEIKNDSFIFLTEFLFKEKLGLSSIEKFFLLKNNYEKGKKENIIYICFVCYNELIITKLDMNNNNNNLSIINRAKIPQNYVKVFYKTINENQMLFDGITLITLFPKIQIRQLSINYSEESYFKSVAVLDDKYKIGILTDKELFIYDINNNKNIGTIYIKSDISSYEMGIKKYKSKDNKNDTLFILYSEKGVYLYDYEKLIMNKKLALEGHIKSKIRKVKQLYNYNIAILYNYYNLAIYNVESDTVSYHYKSNWTKSPGNEDFPLLVKLSNDILLFSSDPNTITILKYSKAEILGFISDKQNKRTCELCKSIKIYGEDLKKCPPDSLNEFYAFIKNSKTTLMIKLTY